MKLILIVTILFALNIVVNAQSEKSVDHLSFAGRTLKTPTGCQAASEFQLQCSNYSMVWLYMNNEMLKTMPEQAINQLSGQLKDFKKQEITVSLTGEKTKAYKITYKNQETGKKGYQIVAYGTVNGQPLLFQFTLEKEPKADSDLPEFARQILKLEKP